jgi:undecaprenyl-diphosphatase
MEQVFQAIVMGVVQGLTEFLPISSSGHLILVPYLLGWDDTFLQSLAFSVVVSAGTLAALLVYFREDWLRLVPAGFATIRDRSFRGDPDRKLAWLIAVATIPAAVAGFLFNDVFEEVVRKPGLVAVMLLVGAAILWLADRWGSRLHKLAELSFVSAFVIGAAQALALIPGFSRSGASMGGGLLVGLSNEDAARFSFLLATPIIGAAALLKLPELFGSEGNGVRGPALVAALCAALTAYLSVRFLMRYFETNRLTPFAAYCFAAGLLLCVYFAVT